MEHEGGAEAFAKKVIDCMVEAEIVVERVIACKAFSQSKA